MATPIGHALAGLAVASLTNRRAGLSVRAPSTNKSIRTQLQEFLCARGPIMALAVFMALAPDLDLIPGILRGQPILYHGGVSHSLGSGVLLSLLAAWLLRSGIGKWRNTQFVPNRSMSALFGISLSAFSTHLLLDMMGPDGREPFGIPLLWPLSDARFLLPTPLLLGVHHTSNTTAGFAEFLSGVFSLHNIMAIVWECMLTIPFILLGEWRIRQRSNLNKSAPICEICGSKQNR
ncbi:MAG: metal-dependent hydrolase [Caldilineaceae bacterium]